MKRLLKVLLPLLLVLILAAECTRAGDILRDAAYARQSTGFSVPSGIREITPYSDMAYQHPDPELLRSLASEACTAAEGTDSRKIIDSVSAFYDAYDWFYTCYSLADLRYSADLSDKYWERETNFCSSAISDIEGMLEDINFALAASPCRAALERDCFGTGYFDSFDGESMWDETVTKLFSRENDLISQYYSQSGETGSSILSFFFSNADEMAQTMVDLILVRQEIAEYLGYDSYASFANDYYYYRDYEPEVMDRYLLSIQKELVPLYERIWELTSDLPETTEADSLEYVRCTAANMGGIIADAFDLLERAGLYDIAPGRNKYNSSFELYFDTYREPFIFMNPGLTAYDHLTLAHEFGHFCNDFASSGSQAGIDVCEIFSQSMEYLSLCYGDNREDLARAKLADSLATYVEQACYATFEQEMYRLPEPSVQALYDLYRSVAHRFGLDVSGFEPEEFVSITHFYTNPMYLSSYIISNDAAMQIYQMELNNPGSGLQCMTDNLATEEPYFLAFLDSAGLQSPFAPDRLPKIRQIFLDAFGE